MERHITEKGDSMVEKLRQCVLKKVACVDGTTSCSTPPPSWRLELPSSSSSSSSLNCCDNINNSKNTVKVQEFLNIVPTSAATISARELCAILWEIQQYQHTPFPKMNNPATRIRRRRFRRHCHRRDTGLDVHKQTPSDQPESANSLRRPVAESLYQHHRSAERKSCDSQPVSPVSYSSSVKVAPYNNLDETLTNSTDFKGMIEDSTYNLTTSKELLNVLNRIWSLEEQQESNISAVKALKMELYHSQAQMKKLLQEKKMNRHEMESLMKQMAVERLVRKSREHSRIKAAVQSINEELEDERRLRKHSEILHRKLARQLSEVNSSFSSCLINLETERKARILLENLCDEFAKGIRDYEREVHSLRCNSEKGHVQENSFDRLILHISEAWLDERMQMNLSQSGNDLMEKCSILDKLRFDIETFLHARQSNDMKKYGYSSPKELKEIYPCRLSMDSVDTDFHDPKAAGGEGLHKLTSTMQSNKTREIHLEKKAIQNSRMKQVQSKEIIEESEFQANLGEENNKTMLMNEEATKASQKCYNNQIGNSPLSEYGGDKVYPDESVYKEDSSCVKSSLTVDSHIVKLWKSMLTVPGSGKASSCIHPSRASPGESLVHCADIESSTKLPEGVKENTLMAKLLEARLERRKSHTRSSKRTP